MVLAQTSGLTGHWTRQLSEAAVTLGVFDDDLLNATI